MHTDKVVFLATVRRIIASAVACSFCATVWAQQTPQNPPVSPRPGKQEILQNLATTQRLLADEQFIFGDRKGAKAAYAQAKATAGKLNIAGGLLTASDIKLIQDEIEYRQMLLDRNASVWGLRFSTRPVNPVGAVASFQEIFNRFKAQVGEVATLADRLSDKNPIVVGLEDNYIESESNARVAELQQSISQVRLRDAEVRRAMYKDRKAAIQARQIQLAAEINALQKAVDSRSAGINATLTKAIAESVGLPPDTVNLVQGAAKGDLEGVIGAAVQQYVQSPQAIGGLPAQLKTLAASAQEAAQKYEEVRRTAITVKEHAEKGAALLKAIQANDRDVLIAIGANAIGTLSPATRDALCAAAGTVKDVDAAIKLAGRGSEVRTEISNYLEQSPEIARKIGVAISVYANPGGDLTFRFQQFLMAAQASATTASQQTEALSALARGWSRTFVIKILGPQDATRPLAQTMGSTCATDLDCADWLIDRIKQTALDAVPVTVSAGGQVTITANSKTVALFPVTDFARMTAGHSLENFSSEVQRDLDSLVARVRNGEIGLIKEVVRRLPNADFDRDVGGVISKLSNAQQTLLLKRLSDSTDGGATPSPASMDLAALSVGRDIAQKTVYLAAATPPAARGVRGVGGAAGDGGDPNRAVILATLKASGPYGFAAATAIEVFSSVAKNGADIDRINEKGREDRDLTAEMLHIGSFELDIQRDEAIATLEERIAIQQYETAGRRAHLYQHAMLDQGEVQSAIVAKIRNRLPLTYLLAEQLREHFDALDHAIAFWANDLDKDKRFVERSLRNDPQWRRFGLDPDIALYDWFSRNVEGQRQDLDALLLHWQGIENLVHTVCANYHCAQNDSHMGQVQMTDLVSIRQLAGPHAWEAAASSGRLLFTLLPRSFPNLPDREGLRLVDVEQGIYSKNNSNPTFNPNIVLRHSGLGYVVAGGVGARETLESSKPETPRFLPDDQTADQKLTDLQARWSPDHGLLPLEGYPLFGLYQIVFPKSFDFQNSDLKLRFYYQFPVNDASLGKPSSDFEFNCGSRDGRQVSVSGAEVQLLLTTNDKGAPALNVELVCTLISPRTP